MNPPLTDTTIVTPSPEVVARDIAGQHILVPVRTGVAQMDYLYTTDEVGSFIYAHLDGRSDARSLARRVASTFEVDEEDALPDVLDYLRTLCEAGLVRVSRPTP
jgi:hypothetical protein